MSLLNVPPEIWREIAQHLSPTALQNAREANRVFLDLAMNAKYHDVRIEEVDDYTVHVLDTLQHLDNAQRVRHFSIRPRVFRSDLGGKRTFLEGLMRLPIFHRMRQRMKGQHFGSKLVESREGFSSSAAKRKLVAIVPFMTSLTDFTIDWDSLYDDISAPYIGHIWKFHGARLTRISITATSNKFQTMFPLPCSFPNLKSLKIEIRQPWLLDEHYGMIQAQLALSSFVNSLRATLEQLKVACTPMRDLSVLYDNLGTFDRLTSLDLNVSPPSFSSHNPQTMGTNMFLQRMGPIMQHLTLSTSSVSRIDSNWFTLADLELPNIHSLTMSDVVISSSWGQSLPFLGRHSSSLCSLAINGPIAPLELSTLLTVVNHQTGSSNITSLSLALYQVTADFFATLARDLYRLKKLCLRIRMLGTSDTARSITPSQRYPLYPESEDEHPFVREMKTLHSRSFSNWELDDLTIMRRSCCGEIILWGLLRLCAQCIPSIHSFNGNGHMVIPDPPNECPGRYDKLWSCNNRLECGYGLDGIDIYEFLG